MTDRQGRWYYKMTVWWLLIWGQNYVTCKTPHFVCRYILSLKGLKISDLLREIVVFFFRSEKTYFHNGSMVQKADLEVQSSGNLWENHLPFLGEIRGDRELKGYIFFSIWDGISSKNGMVDVCSLFVGQKNVTDFLPKDGREERPDALMLLGQNAAGTTPEDSGYQDRELMGSTVFTLEPSGQQTANMGSLGGDWSSLMANAGVEKEIVSGFLVGTNSCRLFFLASKNTLKKHLALTKTWKEPASWPYYPKPFTDMTRFNLWHIRSILQTPFSTGKIIIMKDILRT